MTKSTLKAELQNGSVLQNIFNFTDGQECLIYKAFNFVDSEQIIYIPDIFLNEINIEVALDDEEIESVLHCCYTGTDFVKECKGHTDLAGELFEFVDWQHPTIQDLLATYNDDEFEERYGFKPDQVF